MKTLQQHINETLVYSHSEHINEVLSRLQSDRINEWRASSNTVSSIKKQQYFVYKIDERQKIKFFEKDWPQFEHYNDKIYINGKQIEINNFGWTPKEYDPGTYYVEIKDIDNVTNCQYMFWNCTDLVKVPIFDTSKVKDMYKMFYHCQNLKEILLFDTSNVTKMDRMFWNCENLKDVPLFNTSKVTNMERMFYGCEQLVSVPLFDTSKIEDMNEMFYKCEKLNEQTKKEWSQVYNFDTDRQKI